MNFTVRCVTHEPSVALGGHDDDGVHDAGRLSWPGVGAPAFVPVGGREGRRIAAGVGSEHLDLSER